MNVMPVIIYAAELALAAIILFYVVEMLTMPVNMKRVCQGLIVLIAVLSVIGVLLGSAPPPASHVGPISPSSPGNPSMIR
jgi:hypothetical protein